MSVFNRCYICNKVTSKAIETNAEELCKKIVRDDHDESRMVCIECKEASDEVLNDFRMEDDYYFGWNRSELKHENDNLPEPSEVEDSNLITLFEAEAETEVQNSSG